MPITGEMLKARCQEYINLLENNKLTDEDIKQLVEITEQVLKQLER